MYPHIALSGPTVVRLCSKYEVYARKLLLSQINNHKPHESCSSLMVVVSRFEPLNEQRLILCQLF
jgi:hypothetical protein